MSVNPDDLYSELMNQILFSKSQSAVCSCIDKAIGVLVKEHVDGTFLASFEERLLDEIRQFDPLYKDPEQWSNIRMAKIHLRRLRQKLGEVVH